MSLCLEDAQTKESKQTSNRNRKKEIKKQNRSNRVNSVLNSQMLETSENTLKFK